MAIWITSFEKISSRGTCSHIRDVPYRNRNCQWENTQPLELYILYYIILSDRRYDAEDPESLDVAIAESLKWWKSREQQLRYLSQLVKQMLTLCILLLLVCLANGYSALLVILSMIKDPAYLLRMLTIFHSSPSLS